MKSSWGRTNEPSKQQRINKAPKKETFRRHHPKQNNNAISKCEWQNSNTII